MIKYKEKLTIQEKKKQKLIRGFDFHFFTQACTQVTSHMLQVNK